MGHGGGGMGALMMKVVWDDMCAREKRPRETTSKAETTPKRMPTTFASPPRRTRG
jgi:hypothetical protein